MTSRAGRAAEATRSASPSPGRADAGSVLSYSIVGGADANKFSIDSNTGALSFAAAPDFEAPPMPVAIMSTMSRYKLPMAQMSMFKILL